MNRRKTVLLFLWALFVALNGRLTLEIALIGLAVAVMAFMFMCAYLEWSLQKEKRFFLRLPRLCAYAVKMWVEIAKANLATVRWVYGRRPPHSAIVTIRPFLEARWQMQTLANSITLTPGTLSLECDDDTIVVHCLDESMAEGLDDSKMERDIREMGGKA